jgi:Mg2+ and Co2+ transporter CorA
MISAQTPCVCREDFKNEDESNRHLPASSIVGTLLLPPALITDVFGMNPEAWGCR